MWCVKGELGCARPRPWCCALQPTRPAPPTAPLPTRPSPTTADDPHTKANLLLQAHLGRVPLPISDYVTDTKAVLDNSLRVLQVRYRPAPRCPVLGHTDRMHVCGGTCGWGHSSRAACTA